MTNGLPLASLEAVSADLDAHCEQAAHHPLTIERNGHALVMMMSASEYERLVALDHIAIASTEMSAGEADDLRSAEMSSESIALNMLLSDRAIEASRVGPNGNILIAVRACFDA